VGPSLSIYQPIVRDLPFTIIEHRPSNRNQRQGHMSAEQLKIAEAALEKLSKHPTANPLYWVGDLERCDVCKRPFADARFMIDAHLKENIGACVCAVCFAAHGIGLGWGKGQLYERTQEGLLLVAGAPHEDTDREMTVDLK
jgi:hypothetical protein